jgi:hypothetical protein
MKKTTMLSYLDQQLTKELSDYDIAIDWDTKNHTIEVIFRLFAENNEQAAIDDIDGTSSTEEIIEFEDGVLFYNSEKSQFNNEDFLATIPYEGKKGLRKSVANGFVAYLKDVLDEGQGALLDFLADEQAAVFELNWSATAFNSAVEQAVQKLDQDEYLPYPSY